MKCFILTLALLVSLVNCRTHVEKVKEIQCAFELATIEAKCGIGLEEIHNDAKLSMASTEKYCKGAFLKLENLCKTDDTELCGFEKLEIACKNKFKEIRKLRDNKVAQLNRFCIPAFKANKVKCKRNAEGKVTGTQLPIQPVIPAETAPPVAHIEAVISSVPFEPNLPYIQPTDISIDGPSGNTSGIQSILNHGSFTTVEQTLSNIPASSVEQTLSNVPFATVEQTLANVPSTSNQPNLLNMPVVSVEQTLSNVPFASVEQTLSNVPVVSVEQLLSNVSFASVEQTLSNVPVATIEQTLSNMPDVIDGNLFPILPNSPAAPISSAILNVPTIPKDNSNPNSLSLSNGRKIELKGRHLPNYMYFYLTEK